MPPPMITTSTMSSRAGAVMRRSISLGKLGQCRGGLLREARGQSILVLAPRDDVNERFPRAGGDDPLDAGEAAQPEPGRERANEGRRPFEPDPAGMARRGQWDIAHPDTRERAQI